MKKKLLSIFLSAFILFGVLHSSIVNVAAASYAGPSQYGITDYLYYGDEDNKSDPTFISAIEGVFAKLRDEGFNSTLNSMQKAKLIHDYLIENVSYDYKDVDADTVTWDCASAYSALVKHTAVCEGYASAYKLLMNMAGIPAITVSNENHAWNMVNLDGKWYHVDVTFDDAKINGTENDDLSEEYHYEYFLKSDDYIESEDFHESWKDREENPAFKMPVADDPSYDSTAFQDMSLDDLAAYLPKQDDTLTLDTTSTYHGTVGQKYTFAATSGIGEAVFASSSNSNIEISQPKLTPDKPCYTIYFTAPGTSTITATTPSGRTASFPVTVSPSPIQFTSDTNGHFKLPANGTYTIMITSATEPTIAFKPDNLYPESVKQSGNHYYFKIVAYGDFERSVGIYVDGWQIPTAIADIE